MRLAHDFRADPRISIYRQCEVQEPHTLIFLQCNAQEKHIYHHVSSVKLKKNTHISMYAI